ncbi:MAG: BrnT family toxin [Gammaproteobacteria bacterium]|nr:BrnT family toxin [Gammaproteobacteria bacterium]MBT8444406.1 BrnT family toxin [Gammaproteobacteria bacterium]
MFEWDEEKRTRNLQKHGIDFVDAKEVWTRYHFELPSRQSTHGEDRRLAIGELDGRIVTVVFTLRGDTRRLISARYARRKEKEAYADGSG